MRIRSRARRAAFTLIELMIVVAIIGILSTLAVYGVRKYIANTKTAEARNALGRMGNAAMIAFESETMSSTVMPQATSTALVRALCRSGSQPVPGSAAMIAGRKYQSNPADWNIDAAARSGFSCLHFTIDQPQYYMYTYTLVAGTSNPGDSFVATANGDLNGDGILSTFQLTGAINSAYVLNLAPSMVEILPDE
jgi:prepilin-type N-terminal cleavage/methylation domain-containing protein